MDFIIGVPRTRRHHDSIWEIVETVSNFAHFLGEDNRFSGGIHGLYINERVKLHGVPLSII